MSLTLNQIVKQITTLGNDHEQINFVYFGDVWERLSNGEVTYPAMRLDDDATSSEQMATG